MGIKIENFLFLPSTDIQKLKNFYPDSYICLISSDLQTEEDIMLAYEKAINPPYFGRNWDALSEVLHDFGWIKQKEVVIVHEGWFYYMEQRNIKMLLQILSDAVQLLEKGVREGFQLPDGKHKLIVVFPLEIKNQIEDIVNC